MHLFSFSTSIARNKTGLVIASIDYYCASLAGLSVLSLTLQKQSFIFLCAQPKLCTTTHLFCVYFHLKCCFQWKIYCFFLCLFVLSRQTFYRNKIFYLNVILMKSLFALCLPLFGEEDTYWLAKPFQKPLVAKHLRKLSFAGLGFSLLQTQWGGHGKGPSNLFRQVFIIQVVGFNII